MCRLISIPSGMGRKETLDILLEMEGGNTDGFGYSYLLEDGKFTTYKWALSLSVLLKRGYPILAHLPHKGWTIAHERAASHGAVVKENSHPYEIGDLGKEPTWAICHNGIFSDYDTYRFALKKFVDFKGVTTDSIVAANLIHLNGPKACLEEFSYDGVYLCLNKNGSLHVVKSSGDLVMHQLKNKKILIASELDDEKYDPQCEAATAYYHFDKNGYFVSKRVKEFKSYVSGNTGHFYDRERSGSQISDSYESKWPGNQLPSYYNKKQESITEYDKKYDGNVEAYIRGGHFMD